MGKLTIGGENEQPGSVQDKPPDVDPAPPPSGSDSRVKMV